MKLMVDGKKHDVRMHSESMIKITKVFIFGFTVPTTMFGLGALTQHLMEANKK